MLEKRADRSRSGTLGVGWMAYDAGKHGLAQRYMAQALRIAHAASNRAFGGRILAAMGRSAA